MIQILTNKNNIGNILWLFLFLNPIFDVITSLSIHYTGSSMPIILGIKVSFLFILFLLNFKEKNKKVVLYCVLLFMYCISFLFVSNSLKGTTSIFFEIQSFFRTFFFPISFSLLFLLNKKGVFKIKKKFLCIILFEYLLFLIIPYLTNSGFDSYAISKVGSIGWFNSTNEVGGILAILGPFLVSYLWNKKLFLKISAFVLYVFGLIILGTKVPVLAFGITIILFCISIIHQFYKSQKWRQMILTISVILVSSGGILFLIPRTSFYKNIEIHLDFLEIKSFSDIFTFDNIDHFVFSERLSFLESTIVKYKKSSLSEKIVGMGVMEKNGSELRQKKMIEMDYFDVFFSYGFVGIILFFLPFFILEWKRRFLFEEMVSIFLIILLSLFSGHILVAPSVSVLVVLVFLRKDGVSNE